MECFDPNAQAGGGLDTPTTTLTLTLTLIMVLSSVLWPLDLTLALIVKP